MPQLQIAVSARAAEHVARNIRVDLCSSVALQNNLLYFSMPEEPLNPYAAPRIDSHPTAHRSAPDRASAETLHKVIKLMLITELAYICSWWGVIVSGPVNALVGVELARGVLAAAAISFVAAWFTSLVLILTIKSKTLWIWLAMPIPLVGLIPLVGCINDARRFLLQNGYRPRVFGSSPDDEEIAAMAADPNYVPSVFHNRDGSFRSLPYPLTLTALAITLLVGLTLAVLDA